jgi:hypothetical protein
MKTSSFFTLLAFAALITIVGCQKDDLVSTHQQRPDNMTQGQLDAYNKKLALLPEKSEDLITSRAPITYVATLTSGVPFSYTHTVAGDVAFEDRASHDYYKYTTTSGNFVNVTARRETCSMDPSFYWYTGEYTDTDDLTFEAFADDQLAPACPGPFGDPTYNHAANGGTYTVGLNDFASSGPAPFDYNITVTRYIGIGGCNSTVPDGVHNATTSMQKAINNCIATSANTPALVACVTTLTNTWVSQGKITRAQKSKIVTCAQGYVY